MKKNWIWSVAALATVLAVSCQQNDELNTIKPDSGETHSFVVKVSRSIENEADATRITYSDAAGAQWEIGDQIYAVPFVKEEGVTYPYNSSALESGDVNEGVATFKYNALANGQYRFFYPQPANFATISSKPTARYYCAHEQTQAAAGVWGHADGLVFASDPVELSDENPVSNLTLKLCSAALCFHVYGSTSTDEYVRSISIPGIASGVRDQLCIYTEQSGLTANSTTKEGTTVTLDNPYNVPQFTNKEQCANDGIYMWMVRTSSAVGISFVVNTNKGTYTFTPDGGYQFLVGMTNIYLNLSNSKAVYKPSGNVEISIPDFAQSNVYKVMLGEKQVAQIAKEFLYKAGDVNAQAIVVYPVNDGDAVELSKGFVAQVTKIGSETTFSNATTTYSEPTEDIHGGSVVFSTSSNAITSYTAGTSAPFTKVYLAEDGTIGGEVLADCVAATVAPELIVDQRGSELNTYPVVKIATQYWMAENLRTMYYNKNKDFEKIPTGLTADWKKKPYVVVADETNVDNIAGDETLEATRDTYGLLYSFLAISGDELAGETATDANAVVKAKGSLNDNLAPEGWTVPTFVETTATSHFQALLTYLPCSYVLGVAEYAAGETSTANNLTGFNSRATKYYSPSANTKFSINGSAYALYYSRSRSDQSTSVNTMQFALFNDNTKKPGRNRLDFGRALPIRCVNDGAIKITE